MAENSRFDFCPKCGALARDGVCTSCGYQNPEIPVTGQAQMPQGVPVTDQMQMPQGAPGMDQMQMPQDAPGMGQIQYRQPYPGSYQPYMQAVPVAKPVEKKKSKTTLVMCLILGFVLLALVALILVGVYSIQKRDGNQNIVSDGRQQGWASLPEGENDTTGENEEGTVASSPSFSHFSEDVTQEKRDGE